MQLQKSVKKLKSRDGATTLLIASLQRSSLPHERELHVLWHAYPFY